MVILLLDLYFKLGILIVLVKILLNLILFLPISPNFERMKIRAFERTEINKGFLLSISFPPI